MTRPTSGFFVAALTRRLFQRGEFASVIRHGAEEAGAIFVVVRDRHGGLRLFAPAPQSLADDDEPGTDRPVEVAGGRRFVAEAVLREADLHERWEAESRFDPDFWVVEIETDRPDEILALVHE